MYSSDSTDSDSQWLPVSDLMTVLMLIFMFITIVFMRTVVSEERVSQEECDKIYHVLKAEFEDDFVRWKVDLLLDSTIRFRNPDVLFLSGSNEIRSSFHHILSSFFPRYMESIHPFRSDIREIRIEGHTSSEYESAENIEDAYFLNMALSQDRTRAILHYILRLPEAKKYEQWAKSLITANGLSSSRLIYNPDGSENKTLSRRVEFRLLASSCQKAGAYDDNN